MTKISDLSDYPVIKKLASALHQFETNQHGAAIMIGAGFSRSAARHVGGEKKMPLWDEFSKKLVTELNPNDSDLSFSDPLRVAEEYRAYFGQAALNDQIRSEIDDDAWRTGELYTSLLKLPWKEVMTTNWDTLLERAAKDVHSPYYTPVTKSSDFTWAASPRIVKLHGTIGSTDTFITAQEDYRTYPEKFAPFVNFARQVFIENELCLLGFSGDDPNFLHWAGWVRDHLADHARKIYLVGALKLTAARRKHLESINIAPIDLWDAVKHVDDRDRRHQIATELFLQAMMDEEKSKVKPHEWKPTDLHRPQVSHEDVTRRITEPEYAATLLSAQLEILQKDRESYPGWLVCPPDLRRRVHSQLSSPYPNSDNIAALDPVDRAKLLYEIAWRYGVTFKYIDFWLADQLLLIANPDKPCVLSKKQQMEIALVLLKNSRWLVAGDEVDKRQIEEHQNALIVILEKHAESLPDCVAELAYHQALVMRDELDYVGMEALIGKISGEDPVWKLRQAALLMELGRFDDGEQLIAEAYGELRERHRRDRYSISVLSRLVWAHWLLQSVYRGSSEELPDFAESKFQKWKCDPWTWIENIRESANKWQENHLKSQKTIEPLFEQGHYRDCSGNQSTNTNRTKFLLLEGLSRSVGISLRADMVNLLADSAEKLILSGGVVVTLRDYTLAIRAADSEDAVLIKDVFTRIGVASAPKDAIDTLLNRILSAIGYWRQKRSNGTKEQRDHALSALRAPIESLARLVVRVSPEKAKDVFRLAVSLGQQKNLQHHWLFTVIGSLLTYSLKAIPKLDQGELLEEALSFPLQNEMMKGEFPLSPNPVINHPNERNSYVGIEKRIDELIDAVFPTGTVSSAAALLRLLPLVQNDGFLTKGERDKLVNALWGTAPTYQTLPNLHNLFAYNLLLFPAPDAEQVRNLVCRHFYEHGEEVLQDAQKELRSYPSAEIQKIEMIYKGMANAALNEATRLFPTHDQAAALFDRLVAWRPHVVKDDFLANEREKIIKSICNALAYAIVPALSKEAKTVKRFEQLKSFVDEIEGWCYVIPSFVYFTAINKNIASVVEKIIRKSLQARDVNEVSYAAIAMQKWMELSESTSLPQFNSLISRLIAIVESGRTVNLQQLIWLVGELFKNQRLSEEQVATLIEAIPNAFNAADYANIDPKSQEAVSASSIREACAKLANLLVRQHPETIALQCLLEEARADALPEVRFAVGVSDI